MVKNRMAETGSTAVAEQVLGWLIADPARLSGFMIATGLGPDDLRSRLGDPSLVLAVLEFLLSDEAQLLACCRDLQLAPEAPGKAHAALGGLAPHWT